MLHLLVKWGKLCARCRQKLEIRRCRRRVEQALQLDRRGGVRNDGLKLENSRQSMQIQWRARPIHPWDRDLPHEKHSTLLAEQSLVDTEAAICRLFERLPQVDEIDLTVLDPDSENAIMAGRVQRSALEKPHRLLSVRMRLRELGIHFRLVGSSFEPLSLE